MTRRAPAPSSTDGTDRSRTIATVVVVVAVLAALAAAIARGSYRDDPFEPSSPTVGGAKAVVTVLADGGIDVDTVRRTDRAAAALRDGGTVVVTDPSALGHAQLDTLHTALGAGDGHLVLVTPGFVALSVLAPGVHPTGALDEHAPTLAADARCADATFRARTVQAGAIALDEQGQQIAPGILYTAPASASSCFRARGGASIVRSGQVTVLGSARYVTNAGIGGADDAAVALNALGGGDHLTWYVPSATDPLADDVPGLLERVPPWAGPVVLWLLLVACLALGAWSRRLGPVVIEPLPVTVPSQELTVGRAHLMRRAAAHEEAARVLRSAAAGRIAARLGVSRREGLDALVAAAAVHLGRDPGALRRLLHDEPVPDEARLVRLAHDLDQLEKEIDR